MTEQLLNDSKWRKKNRRCTFLSLIPVLGWMGFVFMGKRSGRKEYRKAGTIYGALSSVTFLIYALLFALGDGFRYLSRPVYEMMTELTIFCEVLLVLLWPVCMVHTLTLGKQYLQFLALKQSVAPERDPLTSNKKWRRENLRWMIWSCFPLLGCFSAWTLGRRLKKKSLIALSMVSGCFVVLMNILISVNVRISFLSYRYYGALETIGVYGCFYFWILLLLVSFLFREDYLDLRATEWNKDTRVFPKLKDRKWRVKNSHWQIWTYFPVVGGIGIALAGVRGGNRKDSVRGVVFCLVNAVLFAVTVAFDSITEWLGLNVSYSVERAVLDVINILTVVVYLIILFYGTFIRWDVLRGRASALQGYGSEFERELDLQNRMRARGMEIPTEPVRQTPKSEPAKPEPAKQEAPRTPDPVPAAPEKPVAQIVTRPMDIPVAPAAPQKAPAGQVDINHCTQEQLMELPGVGIAQAKRAMEHRQTNGGFRSVDEFVELLQIKPHFAVQIFARATVGGEPAVETPAADPAPVRRRIDF